MNTQTQTSQVQTQPNIEEIIRRIKNLFDTYGAMKYIDLWWRKYYTALYLRRYFENNCVEKPIVFAEGRNSLSEYEYWMMIKFPCGGSVDMGVYSDNNDSDNDNVDKKLFDTIKKILAEYGIPVKEKDYGLDW